MRFVNHYLKKTPEEQRQPAILAMLAGIDTLSATDPDLAEAIVQELRQQRSQLKLIASENYSSLAVQLAMGNWMTDKYAEGVPGRRFYAGCEQVDRIEALAQEELKKLFNCDYANVQPHCGSDANLLAYWAVLIQRVQLPGIAALGKKTLEELTLQEYEALRQRMMNQTLMGMSLNSGGHLTHGYRHNLSAKMMRAVLYEVDPKTQMIDYDQLEAEAVAVRPLILLAGYSAYPRRLNFARLREIADRAGAVLIVDMAHFAGLVAGKVFEGDANPVPFADLVTSTTHKTLRGPRGGFVLAKKEWAEVLNKGCPLMMGGPLPHVIAAKAVAFREANTSEFANYAKQIVANTEALAKALMMEGITITTGSTENHLLVIDLRTLGLTGMQAERGLRESGLTANRNAIPFDPMGPWYTSGLRMGTAALTSLGMREREMLKIALLIVRVLRAIKPREKTEFDLSEEVVQEVRREVKNLCTQFPLYPELMID